MTLAASGDFLRANDPDVLRRLVVVEAASAAALPSATLEAAIAALGLPQVAEVTLTAADLAVLDTVPFDGVAAQGSGKAVDPVKLTGAWKDVQGTALGSTIGVEYDGTATPLSNSDGSSMQLQGMDGAFFSFAPEFGAGGNQSGFTLAAVSNKALVLKAGSSLAVEGAIVASAIASGGAGADYEVDDELTLEDATIIVNTVDGGGGEVLTYTITTAGTNNVLGAAQATTGGSGADFTLDIDTLDYSVNPMTLKVKTLYTVMDV